MKKMMKKVSVLCIGFLLLCQLILPVASAQEDQKVAGRPNLNCKSAILIDAQTGRILYEQNAEEALPPASVTKVMTLLLVMEAIEAGKISYTDMISASAHACSMGGSQIYLEEGEQMSVDDLIKSVVIASANDAAVALAEYISGTEDTFVARMNQRAAELGMTSTHFENTNGLDDTASNHVTSAKDIALMSQALIKHKKILEYSSIWMDSIRDGAFGLTNTNRLIRYYPGATGLKTGSTAKAGFCISATAERNGTSLICVIMGAESRDIRNAAATSLLDWGFANYIRYESEGTYHGTVKVTAGSHDLCQVSAKQFTAMIEKDELSKIESKIELPEQLEAPIQKGQKVGTIHYVVGDKTIGSCDIVADETIDRIGFWDVILRLIQSMAFDS